MLQRFWIIIALLCLPGSALAQSLEGTWDFRVDDTAIFRFDIEQDGSGEWNGRWHRPSSFNTDGNNFANMQGEVKVSPSMAGIKFQDQVELSFDDPRPGAIPDIFRFRLLGPDRAEMTYVGTGLAPYPLVRVEDGDVIGGWDRLRVYRRILPETESGDGEDDLRTFDLTTIGGSSDGQSVDTPSEDVTPEAMQEPDEEGRVSEEPKPSLIGDDFLDGL